MPLPRGLIDIRGHAATPEERQAYDDAARNHDWRRVRQFQDRVDFVFQNGDVASLPVARGVFADFVRRMQEILVRQEKSETQDESDKLVPMVPKLPPTLWERISNPDDY